MKPKFLTIFASLVVLGALAQSKDGQMHLRVVDADSGQPLAGVKVKAWTGSGLITDESGNCSFPLPQSGVERFFYRIALAKPGYVGKYITWSQAQKDRIEDIPAEYTVHLDKGVTIGAVVKNEKGEPVPGARVVFSGPVPTGSRRERNVIAPNYHAEKTDENGRWQNSEAPKDFRKLTFRVSHPDYVPAVFGCEGGDITDPGTVQWPTGDFLSGAAIMLLTHGIELSGVVLDPAGKPAQETTITRNHEWRNPAAALTTTEDGRFKISNLRPGDLILTFQAKGLAAQTRQLTLSNGMPDLKIEMKPGNVFQGKVVDDAGKPIAGAHVQMDRLDLGPLEYEWETFADDQGHFIWDSAPDGSHPYYFSAGGYRPRSEPELVADGHDKIIVLRHAGQGEKATFDGHVTDAESKAPITNFAIYVKEFRDDTVAHSQKTVSSTNGDYSVLVDSGSVGCMIEIAAAGYSPRMSDRRSPRDGDQQLDFTLEKGQGITGTVYLPDGKPAVGAEVAVCSDEEGAELKECHFLNRFQTNIISADDNGVFVLPPIAGAQTICAAHAAGFGETAVAENQGPLRIALAPWGSINGSAIADGKPLADERIGLLRSSQPSLDRDEFSMKTDPDGEFVFSNVPPGEVALCQVVNNRYFVRQFLDIKAGHATAVQYGGTGGTIAGKFTVRSYDGAIDWTNGHTLQLSREDGAEQQSFGAGIDPAGGFKIQNVPAGAYNLEIEVQQPPDQGGQRIATLVTNVVIPNGTQLLNLGEIDVPLKKVLKLGDVAPPFEIKTIDGQPLRLSDFRGKFVLLDFWATWCGPCVRETPHLKATYDAFGGGDHFVMIGLSADSAVSAPASYARKNDIKWIQGFLGPASESPVTVSYGVEGIPSIFLLDPEGRIIERDLRGDAIRSAVERALGNR